MVRSFRIALPALLALLVACHHDDATRADAAASSSAADPDGSAATVAAPSASGDADGSPAPEARLATWRTTADIFPSRYDEELRDLVDGLASLPRLTGRHVTGDNPARGRLFRIRNRASENQLFALSFHESPIVRGYFAPSAVSSMPDRYAELAPLLRDAAAVETYDYDMRGTATIASLVLDAFLELPSSKQIDDVLESALADDAVDPLVRLRALEPWGERHHALARGVARRWLSSPSPTLLRAAVGMLGRLHDVDSSAAIVKLADHEDAAVRGEVAAALPLLRREDAEPLVRRLALHDPERSVRERAAAGYVRVPGRKTEIVESLLADPDARVVAHAAGALLSDSATSEDFDLFERFARAHPKAAPVPDLPSGALRQRVLALLGRWLDECGDGGPRAELIARLAEGHDRTRLAAIRSALHDPSIQVRMSAADALATLRDEDSVEPLEKMLGHDDNPYGRLAAANALVTLRAKRSAPLLAKVAARETSWARSDLGKLSNELADSSL